MKQGVYICGGVHLHVYENAVGGDRTGGWVGIGDSATGELGYVPRGVFAVARESCRTLNVEHFDDDTILPICLRSLRNAWAIGGKDNALSGVCHAGSGGIGDLDSSIGKATELNNAKNDERQHGQHKGEFHERLSIFSTRHTRPAHGRIGCHGATSV